MKENKKAGIYKITNKVNGKIYIGSTKNFHVRYSSHISYLTRCKHDNNYLQRSWNKYGEENFLFEVIEYVEDKNKLIEREQYYLDILKPFNSVGYNICKIAESRLGVQTREETKRKISQANKGKNYLTKEQLKKIHDNNCRKILQYDLNGNFIKEWKSITEAENYIGIKGIGKNCSGAHFSVGSYIWRYRSEFIEIPLKIEVRDKYFYMKGKYSPNTKKIGQYNKNGELLGVFYGVREAARKTSENRNVIWRSLKGIVKSPRKYIWKYID